MRRRKSAAASRSSFVCKMLLLVNIASIACGLNAASIRSFPKKDDPILMSSDDPVKLKVSSSNQESKMTFFAQNKDKLSFKAIHPADTCEYAMATLIYGNCEVDLRWENIKNKCAFSLTRGGRNVDVNASSDVYVTLEDGYAIVLGNAKKLDTSCNLDFSPASDGQGGYVLNVSLKRNGRGEMKLEFDSEYKRYEPRTTPKPAATREPPSEEMPGYLIAIIIVSALAVAVSLLLGIAVAVYYCAFKKKGYRWDGTKTTEIYQTATPGTKMRTGTTQPTPTPIIAIKTSKNSKDKNTKKPLKPAISPKKSEANVKTQKQNCIELDSKHEANDKTQDLKCIELNSKPDQPTSHAKHKSSSTVNRLVNGSSVTRLSPTTLEMQSAEDRRIRVKKATAAKEADDKKRREKRIADRIKKEMVSKMDKTSELQPKPAPLFMNPVCTQPESTNESSKKRKVETKQKLQKKQEDTSDTTENSSFWVKTIDSEAQD